MSNTPFGGDWKGIHGIFPDDFPFTISTTQFQEFDKVKDDAGQVAYVRRCYSCKTLYLLDHEPTGAYLCDKCKPDEAGR